MPTTTSTKETPSARIRSATARATTDLLVGGRAGSGPDGWWYTVPNSFITAGGGTPSPGATREQLGDRLRRHLPEPSRRELDGTADFPALCTNADPNCKGGTARTGKWRVEVKAAAAVPAGRPFALAIAGPVTAGSTVRFSDNPIVCNGEAGSSSRRRRPPAGDADPACLGPGELLAAA